LSKINVLVTGASGFIGSHLIEKLLLDKKYNIICTSRNPESLISRFGYKVKVIKTDLTNYREAKKALSEIDVTFYLIHSMEGSVKGWAKFAERDRISAENFARAATECKVNRIIYLGGLSHEKYEELSEHMRSRRQVGEILKKSTAKVTIFQAAVILGKGGKSFEMLRYLVERLPIMVCPKWVINKSQPISVDDVVNYLMKSIEVKETEERTFDIGGPEILSYLDMIIRYAKFINKSIRIIIIPFLSLRLSSYWIDLVTPIKGSIARPLIDSLRHDAIVREESIKKLIPIKLQTFEESLRFI
jgi:uncharacterized protein YbjT (DUF2867 family)